MRSNEDRLRDMLDAARAAVAFSTPLTFEEFAGNRLHRYAIVKAIEIVGEAAANVGPETRAAYPDIPWRKITGMRHRLVHGYYKIRLGTVWATVRDDFPELISRLEGIAPEARP